MTTQDQSVPRYFSDFVQENARQHQGLLAQISEVKGELAIIKAIGVAMLATLLGLLGTGMTGLVTYFLRL